MKILKQFYNLTFLVYFFQQHVLHPRNRVQQINRARSRTESSLPFLDTKFDNDDYSRYGLLSSIISNMVQIFSQRHITCAISLITIRIMSQFLSKWWCPAGDREPKISYTIAILKREIKWCTKLCNLTQFNYNLTSLQWCHLDFTLDFFSELQK